LAISACAFGPALEIPNIFGGSGYTSNGERIYFTATSERGTRIRSQGGSAFGGMMTGRQTCAACHRPDGKGGVHWMHMQRMDAPDIRWKTLSSANHGGHGETNGDEHAEPAYDVTAFQLAVMDGRSPGGERLSTDMPRWQMSDSDLDDLIAFLKTLD
jgi:mono/diheme cytochrome c family protein